MPRTSIDAHLGSISPQGEESEDQRHLLLQRILASPDFVRSPQLARFLVYICTTSFEGRSHTLSEQRVGVEVFGRAPDYDSSADTIVRSHALRLRRRLEQYFQRAGRQETLHLVVPRGGYSPVFLPAPDRITSGVYDSALTPEASENASHPAAFEEANTYKDTIPVKILLHEPTVPAVPCAPTVWGHRVAVGVLASLLIALAIVFGMHMRTHFIPNRHHPLWGRLFTDDQPTRIVLGDAGMVLFHATARKYVSLHDYLSHDLSKQMPAVQHVDPPFAQFLAGRRYTSMVDATTLAHLLRLPEANPERTLVHYSRDMRLEDFKSSNLIIIGAQEAVPWVELFEPSMDFIFSIDHPDSHSSFVDRHPLQGELPEYSSYTLTTQGKVYAVLAFLPNLSATGSVLILEGLSMPGTEAAADLVMDDSRLLSILQGIQRPDGSLPYFELLLEADTLGALGESAKPARVIAVHLHG